MSDEFVSHPEHYNQGQIECCDAMLSAFGPELFSQFCVMNAMKYLWRSNHHKDGRDMNIDKAIWYLTKSRTLEKRHRGTRSDTCVCQ